MTFDNQRLLIAPATMVATLTSLPGAQPVNSTSVHRANPRASPNLEVHQQRRRLRRMAAARWPCPAQASTMPGQFNPYSTTAKRFRLLNWPLPGSTTQRGLLREGTNHFSGSAASGEPMVGSAGSGGRGKRMVFQTPNAPAKWLRIGFTKNTGSIYFPLFSMCS